MVGVEEKSHRITKVISICLLETVKVCKNFTLTFPKVMRYFDLECKHYAQRLGGRGGAGCHSGGPAVHLMPQAHK